MFRLFLPSLLYTMYVVCLLSNYDLEDLQFVLIFRRYFKLQRRIGQLQHISSKCCPGLPDLRAPALVIFYHRSHIKVVLSRVARRMLLCVVGQGHDRWHVHVVVNVISYFVYLKLACSCAFPSTGSDCSSRQPSVLWCPKEQNGAGVYHRTCPWQLFGCGRDATEERVNLTTHLLPLPRVELYT